MHWTGTPLTLLAEEMGVVVQPSGGTNLGEAATERQERLEGGGKLCFQWGVRGTEPWDSFPRSDTSASHDPSLPHPRSEVPLVLRPGGGWRRGAIPALARLGGKSPGPFERRIPRWRRSRGAACRPKGADAERPSWGAPNAKGAPGRRQLGARGGSEVSGSRSATYVLG